MVLEDGGSPEWEITTRLLLYYSERRHATAKNQQRIVGGRIDDLIEFAAARNRMGCIVVDPPWSILGSILPYVAIEWDELRISRSLNSPLSAAISICGRCRTHTTLPPMRLFAIGDFVLCPSSFGARRSLAKGIIGVCPTKSY